MNADFTSISIGILGNGSVGQAISKLCCSRNLKVMMGGRKAISDFFSNVHQASLEEAAQADLVVLALPFATDGRYIASEVVQSFADTLVDKVLIDATNPLGANWSPLELPEGQSGGEIIQNAAPRAHVVKSLNTIFADNMQAERLDGSALRPAGFFCGDNSPAKKTVSSFLRCLGFMPVDTGGLWNARYLEALAHMNIQLAVGCGRGTSTAFVVTDLS